MTPIADQHVLIDGNRIAHGVYGAHGVHGSGEPVVLLHGTPSSSLIWRDVVPAITGAGYRAHLYDLLGFGHSERPRDPAIDTSVTAQVPIFEELLRHWGLEAFHIVAHDIGGAVAKRFALDAPERVRSLTLIDVVSFDSWPSKRTREQMQAGLDKLIAAPDAEHGAHFRDWLLSAVANKERLSGAMLDTYLDFISGPVGQGSLFQHQIRHYDPRHTDELTPRLAELGRLPVQILWGREDGWQVVDWAHKLHAAIPGSALHVLEDCGHFAMEDRPEEIARLALDFIAAAEKD